MLKHLKKFVLHVAVTMLVFVIFFYQILVLMKKKILNFLVHINTNFYRGTLERKTQDSGFGVK